MGRLRTTWELLRNKDWTTLRANLERKTFPPAVYFHNRLVFARLTELRPMRRSIDHITVRPATPADVGALQAIRRRSSGYEDAFGKRHACFIAFAGDEPAAYGWYICGGIHVSRPNGYTIDLGETACYSYGIEVHPAHRMKGAMIKLWQESVAALRQRGFGVVYAAIPEENQLSVKSHTRLGFEPLFTFDYRRLLGTSRWRKEYPDGRVEKGRGMLDWRDPEL